MMLVNIFFLLLLPAALLLTGSKRKQWEENLVKKEHKLYFLYPLADALLKKTGLEKLLHRTSSISEAMKALNTTSKADLWENLYWCSKTSLVMVILWLFLVLSFLFQLQSNLYPVLIEGRYLRRPNIGQGDKQVDLSVFINPEKKANRGKEEQIGYQEDISIHVDQRHYMEEEMTRLLEDAITYLKLDMLGNNQNPENIYSKLSLCTQIPDTGIAVEWKIQDISLILQDGTVNNENLEATGKDTVVTAVLSCQGKRMEYPIKLHIIPRQYEKKDLLKMQLEEKIRTMAQKSQESQRLELPETLEGYRLQWEETGKETGINLLLAGVLIAVLMWFYKDKQIENQLEKREKQMVLDYPEIVYKFTLLVNAGMTIKQAWNKIGRDYKSRPAAYYEKKRYAYEEMLITDHEIQLGISEFSAYEAFGRRTGQLPYMKFCSLIIQNLRKGNKGLSELLCKEAVEAFENRKENAKRQGEEAGTKLLLPMLIMLVTVFAILLIPVFLTIYA